MKQRSFIFVAAFVTILLAGAVALYAYDSSNDGVIAKGVTVAGVDVGEMEPEEARAAVARELEGPLGKPISVRFEKQRFTLSANDAQVKADVGGMVDAALEKSRDGSIFSRVARDLTGGEEDVQVPTRVTYSEQAVQKLVARVKKTLDRAPQDARLNFPSLSSVKERDGVKVQTGALERDLKGALRTPFAGDRVVEAAVRRTKPKVTRDQLANKYPALLVADRKTFKLRFYRKLKLQKEYTIAVGAVGFDTPAGLYHIQNKAVNAPWSVPNKPWAGSLAGTVVPGGSPDNPLKARWLGIYNGAGIHGTDQTGSLGSAASHGCIRMAIPDVIQLYDQVQVQTPVYIA